jgi:hypothetical protein
LVTVGHGPLVGFVAAARRAIINAQNNNGDAKMKNGDLPAMPQNNSETLCQQTGTPNPMHSGLTKREMFAMAAMQGVVTHTTMSPDLKHLAERAVFMADALLAELEKTQ